VSDRRLTPDAKEKRNESENGDEKDEIVVKAR
jgi:hypothetical protein